MEPQLREREDKKIIVLDTNVLLEDAHCFSAFGAVHIGIPIMVLEELDRIKAEPSFRGRNAREVIRFFDTLRGAGRLKDGIKLENGAVLQVLIPAHEYVTGQTGEEVDNQILALVAEVKKRGFDVEFVTKDINLRVKADTLDIAARDYRPEFVDRKTVYKGWRELVVSPSQFKKDLPDDLREAHKENPFVVNEFIALKSGSAPSAYARLFRYIGNNQFKPVKKPDLKWSVQPRNIEQEMALDLLFDPDIRLVTLVGPAGTGKTFLALLAALHEVLIYENFEKLLVTRPIIPLGPDIGYLPGDIREKLHIWMQPIYDNMDYILHAAHKELAHHTLEVYRAEDESYDRRKKFASRQEMRLPSIEELIARHKISLEAITYMRGRSIPYQFILIDEVQNLTPHEVKTLLSRVGEGSKVVLTGDPHQIDAHHLDFSSNGLVITGERFKGQPIFGTVFLDIGERSELSRLASTLL